MRALLLCLLLSIQGSVALAQPIARDAVPEPLRPWIDWALHGQAERTCPFLYASDERHCVWPGRLSLQLDASGGRFTQEVFVAADAEIALPGGDGAWPEEVRANDANASVVPRESGPVLRLARGRHHLSGLFVWSELPPGLRVPAATGLVDLTLDGVRVERPRRDPDGMLWLREGRREGPTDANRVEIEVHRRLDDDVPLRLETRIALRVSGEAREEVLGAALPQGFAPTALDSALPARLDPDGRLRVQLRPGEWQLRLDARLETRSDAFAPPRQPEGAAWDADEIWSVALAPKLRLVDLEGASSIDPTQTQMPPEWRALPAFRFDPEATLRFVEKRRGNQGSAVDQLALTRVWHLDFDADGATVVDQIQGTLRASLRLEMGEDTALGRAAIAGVDQPITRRAGSTRLGIETALGALDLAADSRVEGKVLHLPAVGWAHDFDAVSATLMIPPGYRLLHVTGVDAAESTWISRWDLLAIFFVLLIGVATGKLFGAANALLAVATLALLWPEAGAPKLLWLALVVAAALRQVAPPGRAARTLRLAQLALLVCLTAVAVPFAVRHLRVGFFPALERPQQSAEIQLLGNEFAEGAVDQAAPQRLAMAPAAPAPPAAAIGSASELRKEGESAVVQDFYGYGGSSFERKRLGPDPAAAVPTGPGRPDWSWEAVALRWNGPVTQQQQLGLWLAPPWANTLLAVLRVLLLAALARVFALAWRNADGGDRAAAHPAPPASAAAGRVLAAALAGIGLLAAPGARAELPAPELLDELRERLLAPPDCAPQCATLTRLAVAVQPDRLELRLGVDAAAETGVPLPGGGAGDGAWLPSAVLVDGAPAIDLLRSESGVVWLRLAPGRHEIQLAGALPQRATVELPLPLAPKRAGLAAPARGWSVVGLQPDGSTRGALQFVRETTGDAGAAVGAALEATPIPPFVRVVRSLEFGLNWESSTFVQRVAPVEGAIVVEVPLLPGESVTTPGVKVEQGRAFVALAAGESAAAYTSTLAIAERIDLAAPSDLPWTEVWQIAAGPLWHVETSGIPAVDEIHAGSRALEFRPWPGEKLSLAIERPAGEGGATLTIDRSHLVFSPGLRASDALLTLALRSSQGGQHTITLPEGAQLTSVAVNGAAQPLRQEGRRVPLTLAPGAREIALGWREPHGIRASLRVSDVDLGIESVNAHVEIELPAKRWVLYTAGPRLGPSVLFWSSLAVLIVLAWLLGRFGGTPLAARHWLLLGLGLTQAPYAASLPVVACLLLLGWRGRAAQRLETLRPRFYELLQLALLAVAVCAAFALVYALQHGLLGAPEMRIAGNGSSSDLLRWYLDRSAAHLPRPWVVSLSIWWYRAVMLGWSLWLAFALVGWARWGFAQWSAGGALRPEAQSGAVRS